LTNNLVKFYRKIFKRDPSKEDTIPIIRHIYELKEDEVTKPLSSIMNVDTELLESPLPPNTKPPQIFASCAQSKGQQRDHNEDAMFCLTTTISTNGSTTPFGLYIVADGMGGHQHGEIASDIATRTMAELIIRNLFTNLISVDPKPPDETIQEIIRSGILAAHENIIGNLSGGGTTLTAVTLFSNQMTIAHVGDSRVYSISLGGKIVPLTRDHSLVKRLEELGKLTTEEAAVDPRRNVLYHALGQGSPLEPEIISTHIPDSGYLLVCSDGLWGVISEEEISKIIMATVTLPQTCQELIDAANEAGGPDNISAILIQLPTIINV
jgi:serine/threonine protein phosphatase PrpC